MSPFAAPLMSYAALDIILAVINSFPSVSRSGIPVIVTGNVVPVVAPALNVTAVSLIVKSTPIATGTEVGKRIKKQ